MSKRTIVFGLLFAVLILGAAPAGARLNVSNLKIYLQRGTFDPLRSPPAAASASPANPQSRLLLVQFDTPPTERTRAALAASGLRPLLYIPDNAWLVRATGPRRPTVAALPGLRWSGPFLAAYKLPSDLDMYLRGRATGNLDLRLLAAPDAEIATLERDLEALGGAVLDRSAGLNGTSLHLRLPAAALGAALDRDDVAWVERFGSLQIFNDQSRQILGVAAAHQRLGWLTGAGQVVAVTDTGLDVQAIVQANANPDFAADRIARGFSKNEMYSGCSSTDWSDQHGHGTHVSGSVLGSGARSPSGHSFLGVAPQARLIVQAVSSGGSDLDCLPFDSSYLSMAYDAGARLQNASWGGPTGGSSSSPTYGGYTVETQAVDEFLWSHKDHLFVVAAGNEGFDKSPRDGVIDADSINTPGTAKNVLTVGSSESFRPPTGGCSASTPENFCWSVFGRGGAPFGTDFASNNVDGMAAFSSRGPTDDGRIKPEIVAPGTNIVSAASHDPSAFYFKPYNADYAYDSGTSMSAPLISGMAALVRQWLAQARATPTPSAALLKALLLNGAVDISPGQYGAGLQREIPAAWPNNAEGWGRATLTDTIDLDGSRQLWFVDSSADLQTGVAVSYTLAISGSQSLRVTLAWTDYPSFAGAGKALVNDLDLEVRTPDGAIFNGNFSAALPSGCRDSTTGADRCNNSESVEFAIPSPGTYMVRVSGAAVPQGPQPFAVVARRSVADAALAAPALQPIAGGDTPALALAWSAVEGASYYEVQESTVSDFATLSAGFLTTSAGLTIVEDLGTYYFRVRSCQAGGCGVYSNTQMAVVTTPPQKIFLPLVRR